MAQTTIPAQPAPVESTPFFQRFRNLGVLAVLLLLVVGSAVLTPQHTFIGPANIRTLLALGAEFGVIALGVGVLMIAGEFDLSVGSILGLCALVFTLVIGATGNPFVGAIVSLLAGALLGALNGVIVVRGRIVSFVATLGTMLSLRGLTEILSGGKMLPVDVASHPVFMKLTGGVLFDLIPAQAIWFVLFALALFVLLSKSKFGNWIYSTGDNAQAARAMGVRTGLVKTACFAVVGVLCAFAAVLQMARVSAFSVHMGEGWEMRTVAAAVVGGTSLQGGRGSMLGIFLGTVIIIVVDNMISQLRLAYEYTYVVFGLVIIAGVLLDLWIERQIQRSTSASNK